MAFPGSSADTSIDTAANVVATDAGWLAVGHEDPLCQINCGLAPIRALVWTSTDGLHWTRIPDQAAFRKAGMDGWRSFAGAAGFVAAGTASGHAAFWSSADGTLWSRVADAPTFHAHQGADGEWWAGAMGVAANQNAVVLVGMDGALGGGDSSVRAWWSADGQSWTPATVERADFGQVFDVTRHAVRVPGNRPSGIDSCTGGIWRSADGRAWTCDASRSTLRRLRSLRCGGVRLGRGRCRLAVPGRHGERPAGRSVVARAPVAMASRVGFEPTTKG